MNWTDFIKYLGIVYLIYYGVNVIIDLLKPQKGLVIEGEEDLLEFSESIGTTIIEDEPESKNDYTPDESTGNEIDGRLEEWVRDEGDTEELNLISENVNVSTG